MRSISKRIFVFLVFSGCIFAQHLDFGFGVGVKGGVPFTEMLELTGTINSAGSTLTRSTAYLVGPAVEMRLPFGFAVEADGLYHASEYDLTTNGIRSTIPASA